jgi:HSP20 family protein
MSIEKWNPLREMDAIRRDMDRIWSELFPSPRRAVAAAPWRRLSSEEGVAIAPLDLIDAGDSVLVRVEMPGVTKDALEISVADDTLTIKGEVKEEKEYKTEEYYHSERSYKAFARSVGLPTKIDEKRITAQLKNGVLEIRLPKAEEVKPKKIKVEVA